MATRTFEVEANCEVEIDVPDDMSISEAKEMAEYEAFSNGFDNWNVDVYEVKDDE